MSIITKEQLRERAREKVMGLEYALKHPGAFAETLTELEEELELARIALVSLEAEAVAYIRDGFRADGVHFCGGIITAEEHERTKPALSDRYTWKHQPLYTAPPAPVSVPESAPVAYIFKHPAGRLFWSLTDESNKGQSDVMPVYSAPVPAFVPPAIEPDYEVIKGILPTANPDEYACCIAADMWNACRAAMLQGAEQPQSAQQNIPKNIPFEQWLSQQTDTIDVDCGCVTTEVFSRWLRVAYEAGNSPVIPDGWVACSERMPEDDDFVYIWPRPDFGVELHVAQYGKFDKRDAGWYAQVYEQNYGIEYYPVKVTHWMPLPAAPQQEVNNDQ